MEASDAVQDQFVKNQPGYIDRELLRDEKGHLVDIVHWNSMDEALQAAECAKESSVCLKFFEMIDLTDGEMNHLRQMKDYSRG